MFSSDGVHVWADGHKFTWQEYRDYSDILSQLAKEEQDSAEFRYED